MDDFHTVSFPEIEANGKSYSQITLRAPTFNEARSGMRKWKTSVPTNAELEVYQLDVLSRVAGVPSEVIQNIPIHLFGEAWDFLEGFILGPKNNGGVSSQT